MFYPIKIGVFMWVLKRECFSTYHKYNLDMSLYHEAGIVSFGCCVRNSEGEFILARTKFKNMSIVDNWRGQICYLIAISYGICEFSSIISTPINR